MYKRKVLGGGGYLDNTLYKLQLKNSRQNTHIARDDYATLQCVERSNMSKKYVTKFNNTKPYKITLLLSIVVCFVVFMLLPLHTNTNVSVDAGRIASGDNENKFYSNAPAIVVGGEYDSQNNEIVSIEPLFTENGVNVNTLFDLYKKVNNTNVWKQKKDDGTMVDIAVPTGTQATFLSAKNFGQYGDQSSWTTSQQGNAQIVVKLFDDATLQDSSGRDVSAITSQYWQAVYRSIDNDNDILTLYMISPYTYAMFNPIDSDIYPAEGNYGASYLRQEIVLKAYQALQDYFVNLDTYTISPSELLGDWQSASVQTSLNASLQPMGAGASSYMHWTNDFAINNGLDGQNYIPSGFWTSSQVDASGDKMWIPSAFELQHTGYGSSESELIAHSQIAYDNNYEIGQLNNGADINATLFNPQGDTRTGLWEMSAYDRANNAITWLRTAIHTIPYGAQAPNMARALNSNGHHGYMGVQAEGGVQVALHIDLKQLIEDNFVDVDNIMSSTGAIVSQPNVDGGFSAEDLQGLQIDYQNYMLGKVAKSTQNDNGTMEIMYEVNSNDYVVDSVYINGQTITLVNGKSNVLSNGICDINSYTINNVVHIELTNFAQDVSSFQPLINYFYQLNLGVISQINDTAILLVSGQSQNFAMRVVGQGNIGFNIPNLICEREYTLTLIGGVKFDTSEVNVLINGTQGTNYTLDILSENSIKITCAERDAVFSISGLKIVE